MKKVLASTILSVLLLASSIFAGGNNLVKEDKGDVEQVITNFVKSVDVRDAGALSKSVISTANIFTFNQMANRLDNYSASQFVDLVKNGQKGGWTRTVSVSAVDVDGNVASAKIDITDSRLKETGYVTLIKDNGTWKVATEVTTLGLNK
ncbi:MAG: nuclear transport factor 2 family protein [Ignavibacteriaceae bacterium]|nr:nuclear transport factor 2 family protein [Ignavibacteriaceae bacterium]